MTLVHDSGGPWDIHWHVEIADNGGYSTQNYDEYDGYYWPGHTQPGQHLRDRAHWHTALAPW